MNCAVCVAGLLAGFGPWGFRVEGQPKRFAVSRDGETVVCPWYDRFDIYDVPTGKRRNSIQGLHPAGMQPLTVAPDGRSLGCSFVFGMSQYRMCLFDLTEKAVRSECIASDPLSFQHDLAFFPDGRLLCSSGGGGVHLLAPGYRDETYEVRGGEDVRAAVAVHPTGRYWAYTRSRKADATLLLRGVGRAAGVRREIKLPPAIAPIAFHPSGRTVIVATGSTVHAYEVSTGRVRWSKALGSDGIYQLLFSSGGSQLAARGKAVEMLDADSGAVVSTFRPPYPPNPFDLAAGGGKLFTLTLDSVVRVWPWPELPARPAEALPPSDRLALAVRLAGDDAAAAFAAIRRLSADPAVAVELARANLVPSQPLRFSAPDVWERVRRFEADDFDVRETASRELAAMGAAVAPELRRALWTADDPEVVDRLTTLLRGFKQSTDATDVAAARWLEVLERVGTPDAVELVRAVAGGDPDHPRTEDARDTLARMEGRKPGKGGGENRR